MSRSDQEESQRSKRSVLLVEDEILIAMAQKNILQEHGYNVVMVSNGPEAVREGSEDWTDLVLMDIDLGQGKMDGIEAALQSHLDFDIPGKVSVVGVQYKNMCRIAIRRYRSNDEYQKICNA